MSILVAFGVRSDDLFRDNPGEAESGRHYREGEGGDVGGGDYGGDAGGGDYGGDSGGDYGGGETAGDGGDYGGGETAGDGGDYGGGETAGDSGDYGGGETAGDSGDYSGGETAGDSGDYSGGETAGDSGDYAGGETAGDSGDYGGGETAGDSGDYAGDETAGDSGDYGSPDDSGQEAGAGEASDADGSTADQDAPQTDPAPASDTDTSSTDPSSTDASGENASGDNTDRPVTDADVAHALELAALQQGAGISDSDPSLWESIANGQVPGVESAFYPADHFNVTQQAANQAGFDQAAANAFAAATRNVDYQNFADEAAHANAAPGQSPEQAAQVAIDRATQTGENLAAAIETYAADPTDANAQAVVNQVGAINHQLQDSYAHQGMTFDQHASMDHNGQTPDRNPAALAEAGQATNEVMNNVAQALEANGINPADFHPPAPSNQFMSIVQGWNQWGSMAQYQTNTGSNFNGVDTRWPGGTNNQILQGFQNGLNGSGRPR